MAIAIVSVSFLIWLTLGLRESWIVFLAIPVTLALTLTTFFLYGYTLNRITLFALIFSIGILVDDAIVVVENIVRHRNLPKNKGRSLGDVAVEAVDEVGKPDHPGDPHRHRRHSADGVCRRPDGSVHAPDPGWRDGGDDLLPDRSLPGHPVGGGSPSAEDQRPRSRGRRGPAHQTLPQYHGAAASQQARHGRFSLGVLPSCC